MKAFRSATELVFILLILLTDVQCQFKQLPQDEWVDPPGYPSTLMEYLRVIDAFLGGLTAYDLVPESRVCVSTL